MKRHVIQFFLSVALAFTVLTANINQPVAAQAPAVTTLQNAASTTANGSTLDVKGPAANPVNAMGAVGVGITNGGGTFTVTFETLVSGSTWVAVMATNLTTDTRATTTSTAGQYTILLGGAVQFRARVSACSGCSVTVAGRFIPGMVAN